MAVQEEMRRGDTEAADIAVISAECYLRESDRNLLHPWDVVYTEALGVSLLIGNPDAGESAKTGSRQGVRPDRRVVEQLLLRRRKEAISARRKRLFSITAAPFCRAWVSACTRLGYNPGPPHSLKHTGPSFDALEDATLQGPYRTLDAIQARGRWKLMRSVLRYSKTHTYNQALASMPDCLRARGAQLYSRIASRSKVARI